MRFDLATGDYVDDFIPEHSGGLDGPGTIAYGPDGHLYVSSVLTDEVLRFNRQTGAFIDKFIEAGAGGLDAPHGLAFGPNDRLYVGSYHTDEVLEYLLVNGLPTGAFVTSGSGGLDAPQDITFGPDGHLYVSSLFTNNVLRYDGITGDFIDEFVTTQSGGIDGPRGLLFAPDGYLYVSSFDTNEILRYVAPPASEPTSISSIDTPASHALLGNFPNPFASQTRIRFQIAQPTHVELDVYDVTGRLVKKLLSEQKQTGEHEIMFTRQNLPNGLYFYRLQAGDVNLVGQMSLLR